MEYSQYLHIFDPENSVNKLEENERCYTFPYELDNFQEEGVYHIHNNEVEVI